MNKKFAKKYIFGLNRLIVASCVAVLLHGLLYILAFSERSSIGITLIGSVLFFLLIPVFSLLFGFYSYAITKRILIPHFYLLLGDSIVMGVLHNIRIVIEERGTFSLSRFLAFLPLSGIITGISLITALVAMWEHKTVQRRIRTHLFETNNAFEDATGRYRIRIHKVIRSDGTEMNGGTWYDAETKAPLFTFVFGTDFGRAEILWEDTVVASMDWDLDVSHMLSVNKICCTNEKLALDGMENQSYVFYQKD